MATVGQQHRAPNDLVVWLDMNGRPFERLLNILQSDDNVARIRRNAIGVIAYKKPRMGGRTWPKGCNTVTNKYLAGLMVSNTSWLQYANRVTNQFLKQYTLQCDHFTEETILSAEKKLGSDQM